MNNTLYIKISQKMYLSSLIEQISVHSPKNLILKGLINYHHGNLTLQSFSQQLKISYTSSSLQVSPFLTLTPRVFTLTRPNSP